MTDNTPATDQEIEHIESVADSGGYTPTTEFRIRSLIARIRAETAKTEEDALGYATRIATNMAKKCYSDRSPEWKPLPDVVGILTQIDNMLYGMVRAETAKNSGEVVKDAVDNMIDFILSDETPVGPEDQPNIDMFNKAIESAKDRLHHEAIVNAAYDAAVKELRGTSADVGAGELDRIVRAVIRAALATPANSRTEAIRECIAIADTFTCGLCGMDGEVGDALRALLDKEAEYMAVTDNDEFTRDNVEKTTAANTALYEAWLAERSSPSLPLNNNPQPDSRAEAIGAIDDDELVKVMFKNLPSKVYDALTFERHPPMFPQATYDVPTVEARKFAEALRALLQKEGE